MSGDSAFQNLFDILETDDFSIDIDVSGGDVLPLNHVSGHKDDSAKTEPNLETSDEEETMRPFNEDETRGTSSEEIDDVEEVSVWLYENNLNDEDCNDLSREYLRAFRPRMDITYSPQISDIEFRDSFEYEDQRFLVDSDELPASHDWDSNVYSQEKGNIDFEKYYLMDALDTQEIGTSYTISEDGILSLDYNTPVFINGQRTYQRIVFEADKDGESVYDMTKRRFRQSGIEASSKYDKDFDSILFTSINDMAEGSGGNFNEFYLNGVIGENAVDKQTLAKGDVVEWRFAEENDDSCGDAPDYDEMNELLGENKWKRGLYSGNNWDSYKPLPDWY